MKPALNLRISQQLALTPQLQQAIRLLQLSSIELELELREALESNPLLEVPEAAPEDADENVNGNGAANGSETPHNGEESASNREEFEYAEPMDFGTERYGYGTPPNEDFDGAESQDQEPEDLRDHLLWQLNLTHLSDRDRAIGIILIESIGDDGYLHESVEALQAGLVHLGPVDVDEIEAMRHRIQHFDPIGVASRNLADCLRVQLAAFDSSTPGLATARTLVNEHLESLARNDRTRLCKQLRTDAGDLDDAIALIRSLDPKPGTQIDPGKTEYAAPDAYAFKQGGRWHVRLSQSSQPKLSINQHYAGLIARARRDDASYLRGQLQEARWLIKSLQARAETLLKVANAIVRAQHGFLEFGPEAMRPLVLRDIAEEIGMHESTVSRVTTRKYLHTPRGTFEFKYFFSSGVSTVDGGAASATAIQAMIKRLIDEENSAKPLSDQALAQELNRRGIEVARRTVAKYREAMHIPSSNERSRLG